MYQEGPDQVIPASSFKTSEADGAVKLYITEDGPTSESPVSLYTMFKRTVDKYPNHPALIVKRGGQLKHWTFCEYFEQSKIVAKAFIRLGLERFHGVCIMGFNSPEWMMSYYGTVFAGGLSAGVYTTNSPESCRHVADNCHAQIIVVENNICLNKILAVKRFLPHLKAIVQWSGNPEAPGVMSWAELMAIGMAESDDGLNARLSMTAVNQCCTLIYTSGTTGPPKGVMCSQDVLSWMVRQYHKAFKTKIGEEVFLSYLPLSHLAGLATDAVLPCFSAATVYFASPDALKGTLVDYMVDVQPTGFLAVPRIFEKMYEGIREAVSQSGWTKQSLFKWARYYSLLYYNSLQEGRSLTPFENLCYGVAKSLILNKVKAAVGLSKCINIVTGTAPIAKHILEFFLSLDIPIMECYGLSESMSVASMSLLEPGGFKLGSVGKVLEYTNLDLDTSVGSMPGEGEIIMRGRNLFMGYLKMPAMTDETLDDEGWLHTGDLGSFDTDGFLHITGRIKELIITAGGENIPPLLIQEAIKKELPVVSNALLVGDKQKYLTVLLTLKSEMNLDTGAPLNDLTLTAIKWMSQIGSSAKTVSEAISEVKTIPRGPISLAIQKGIDRYNDHHAASHAQRVQKWCLLPHDFSLPTGELNNTLKVKRKYVLEKYVDYIELMYSSERPRESKL